MTGKKTIQSITDFYRNQGLKGKRLRKAVEKDEDYQHILTERRKELVGKFKISPEEEEKYLLSTNRDYQILAKVKQLEKVSLSPDDEQLVEFIRSQLERDWRKGILDVLDKLFKKYQLFK